MAVDYTWLLEQIDTESPGDSSFNPAQAEATLFFVIQDKDLTKAYRDLLGFCKLSTKVWPNQQTGGLERQIAMSHPRYPMLYCDSVEIVGVSSNGKQASNNFQQPISPLFEYPYEMYSADRGVGLAINYKTNPYVATYKMYRLAAHFKAVPYFALTDEQLAPAITGNVLAGSPKQYDYWIRNDADPTGFSIRSYYDYCEYLRFCNVNIMPENEVIANTNGRTYWHTAKPGESTGDLGAPQTETPLTQQSSPTNFQNITKNKIEITWYKVPRTILTNPQYITSYGMVNYGPNYNDDAGNITIWNYEFFNFAPGTLMYTGITYKNIQSNFPIIPMTSSTELELLQNPINNQYVDITFNFWQFVQPKDQIVEPFLGNIAYPDRGKMYSGGWNMVPAPNRLFYYVESNSIANKNIAYPPYMSYPFPRLYNPQAT